MSALFISHSSADNLVASEIRFRLEKLGHCSVFLDFDPAAGIPGGREWEQEIYRKLRMCQAVIILCSEHSEKSKWCFAEVIYARGEAKRLIPVKIGPCTVGAPLDQTQIIDYTLNPEAAMERLRRALGDAGLEPSEFFPRDDSRSPYPGLASFEEADACVYFAREKETQQLVEQLNRSHQHVGPRFSMVLGASGSGKSSLVRAGVVPRLKKDLAHWVVVQPFTPRGRPCNEFALSLERTFRRYGHTCDFKKLRGDLDRAVAGDSAVMEDIACELRSAANANEAHILIVVDQVEELLNLNAAGDSFFLLLRRTLEEAGSPWLALGTLRSDFLAPLQLWEPTQGLEFQLLPLPAIVPENLLPVIQKPAALADIELETGLVDAIVADTQTGHALPLLAFALRKLWEDCGKDRRFTLAKYRDELGGLQGALARTANQAIALTNPNDIETHLRGAFMSLVHINDEGRFARRIARWEEIPAEAHDALESLVRARLLVSRGEGQERFLEVAHESLFQSWDLLRSWLVAENEFLLWRRRFHQALSEWNYFGKGAAVPLTGVRLAEAESWNEKRAQAFTADEREYLEQSIKLRTDQEQREKERQDHERELYVSSEKNARFSRSRELATAALLNLDVDPERSILLALQGVSETYDIDGIVAPETHEALRAAVETSRILLTLRGHSAEIRRVAYSPAAAYIASVSDDETAKLWDAKTGDLIRNLEGHHAVVTGVDFNNDGSQLATSGRDGTARIWEVASGRMLLVLSGHEGWVNGVAFRPDGKVVATAGEDKSVRLWDSDSGAELAVLLGHKRPVSDVAFDRGGDTLVSASEDETAIQWHVENVGQVCKAQGQWRMRTFQHEDRVTAVTFCPDSTNVPNIATASYDKRPRIYRGSDGTTSVLVGHGGWVSDICYHESSGLLATASYDGTARVWEGSGRELVMLRGHTKWVTGCAFSPDGTRLATCSADRTVRIWRVTLTKHPLILRSHTGWIGGISYSPLGDRIATAGDDAYRVWDAQTGELLLTRESDGELCGFSSIVFSPSGKRLLTGCGDHTARLWSTTDLAPVATLRGHTHWVGAVAFDRHENLIATSGSDLSARVWNAESGKQLLAIAGHEDWVNSVAFSPDGRTLATASNDKTAKVWDVESGRLLRTFAGHAGWLQATSFHPAGKFLATVSHDCEVRLWDVESGAVVRVFTGHTGWVRSLSFNTDGSRLATASADRTIRIWDTSSGVMLLVIFGHADDIWSVAYSPDGTRIASAGSDQTARVWDAETGVELFTLSLEAAPNEWEDYSPDGVGKLKRIGIVELTALARTRVTRQLTPDERTRYLHQA